MDLELVEPKSVEKVECLEVTETEAPVLIKLGELMIQKCTEWGGIGLAAPQIGVNKRMFVWQVGEDENGRNFQIVFNPKYFKDGKEVRMLEGCLSYKADHFIVERYKHITAVFYTFYEGKFLKVSKPISGIRAVVFQHETDHVNGTTIAMKGEKLDEEKNKEFIENIRKNEGLPPGARTGEAPAAMGNSGSATYSFEPNLTSAKENK
jgi:peptide deformylase